MAEDSLTPQVGSLLAEAGRSDSGFRVAPLEAGGNNRVYSVWSGSEHFAAKWYFHDPTDRRDRLGAEYGFLAHAWRCGLRCVPQPYASDPEAHLALYAFVEGARPAAAEVDRALVLEAAQFFARLNAVESRAQAVSLPMASEACFSTAEHLQMVDQRIGRLDAIAPEPGVHTEARHFVARLAEQWVGAKAAILAASANPAGVLPQASRCLSPSDFGFHNALRRPDGALCFIDFEYAGWDDPAKAIGDFFAHPGVPVPRRHYEDFLRVACAPFPDPESTAARARMLEPVFRVKWCCIILNEFLPDAARRRRFADPAADSVVRKRRQLAKARALFDTLTPNS